MRWWLCRVGVWAVGVTWVSMAVGVGGSSAEGKGERPSHLCTTGWFECVSATVKEVWNLERVEAAAELRRAVREVGRKARDLSSILSPFIPSASVVAQVLSFLPAAVDAAVRAVSSLVYAAGTGVTVAGSGLSYGASAVQAVGTGIATASYEVPTVVTLVLLGGLALLLFFPGIQDTLFSFLASAGLALAGYVTSGARNFVADDSFWATILDTLHHFMRRCIQL